VALLETRQRQPRGTPPDTDGESMIVDTGATRAVAKVLVAPSAPDGLRVVSEHIGDNPDASFAAYDRLIG
jgi:hypothetical protein